jgi:4-hydroxy-2-oxoheptanedioate aldolase
MAATKLRLLNALNQGKPSFATFMALKGMRSAQVIAHTGMDVSLPLVKLHHSPNLAHDVTKAVIIDREHGYINDSDMHNMVSAVSATGSSPIVRIRGTTGPLIKRALDTGAQ